MHKKIPKICTGCRVSAAKIYLYHSTKIAKARPHSVEWQTDSSVQKQWFMSNVTAYSYINASPILPQFFTPSSLVLITEVIIYGLPLMQDVPLLLMYYESN